MTRSYQNLSYNLLKGHLRAYLPLFFVFTLCFLLPFAALVFFGKSFLTTTKWISEGDVDSLFPKSFVVNGPGSTIKVNDSGPMNPASGKDYLFFVWFKLRRPLENEDRVVFVGKYDPKSKTRPGYSVGLVRDRDGTRPIVYWQTEDGPGKWYTFSPTEISARSWYLIGISFREGQYLGVHLTEFGTDRPVQPLGGYDLEKETLPTNDADLVLGAFAGGRFRGRIGPFGVISRPKLTADLVSLMTSITREPNEVPSNILPEEILLWFDGTADRSAKHRTVNARE